MGNREETKMALIRHCKRYPKLQVQDLLKYLYQSAFRCEHMIASPEAVEEYITKEAEHGVAEADELIEPLDGDYCRVHLDCIREGLDAGTLAKLFFLSSGHVEDGTERLLERLSVLTETAEEGLLPFTKEAVDEVLEE